ncbi:MAG: hypothetical protein ACXIUV_09705 [Alkalilacustris sp.]
MASWLDDVQRDPRTLGAFRRRIESLLTDPAVARRIARRLDGRAADRTLPEPDRRPAERLHCITGPSQGLFGRCDCPAACCVMLSQIPGTVPSLASLPMLAAGYTRH